MLHFHTKQANASISASTRKRKNFDPYACACAYACVASENQALDSLNMHYLFWQYHMHEFLGIQVCLQEFLIQNLSHPAQK